MNIPGEFSFIVLNDLHYMDDQCRPWLEGLVRQVNATPNIELVLVLGDLAETGSHEELAAAKSILDQIRVAGGDRDSGDSFAHKKAYYPVPGNHDGPPGRALGSGVPGLKAYEALFPNSRNYWFGWRGWQFIGLDTTNGSGYQNLPIPEDTLAFAAEAAKTLDADRPTILFTHMPLDPTIRFASSEGYRLLEILRPLNLRIVFSGHFHGLTENVAPGRPGLKLLTNRCCSRTRELHEDTTLRGYWLCKAHADGRVTYQFVEYRGG